MKAIPARLDTDGKSIPRTKLVREVNPKHCVSGRANANHDVILLKHVECEHEEVISNQGPYQRP